MLGKRASDVSAAETPEVEDAAPAGKGRPTPKRADARKARRTAAPSNRKDAAAQLRDRNREQRRLARQALITGDEKHLPPRDAGPERRLARDVVDSRLTLGQYFPVLIFGAFALSLVNQPAIRFASTLISLLGLTAMVIDSARHGRRAKEAVAAKFGDDEVRGISSYGFLRAFLPRRFRKPPPKVERGATVA
jgi:hypothetical protein